jgi:hypothetical protein
MGLTRSLFFHQWELVDIESGGGETLYLRLAGIGAAGGNKFQFLLYSYFCYFS